LRPQSGRTEVDGKPAATLRFGIDFPDKFFTLDQVRSQGASITLIPSAEAEERGQWQLQITFNDGFSKDYFIDRKNYRIERPRDHRSFHPAVDSTEITIETSYGGDLRVKGVLGHARSENQDLLSGDWRGTTVVQSIEHNIPIADDFFTGK
jgi:hypothetical protein